MKITKKKAKEVAEKLGVNLGVVSLEMWQQGMQVEMEHGKRFGALTNITNDDAVLAGKIALAHLLEFPDYYQRLKALEEKADRYWKNKEKPDILL